MEKIRIGKIVNAAGLKGEVKIYNYAGSNERYGALERIYVEETEHTIEKVRYVKNVVVAKLSGIGDRSAAEEAKGKDVYMDEAELPELPAGEYYVRDLVGLSVTDDKGGAIGRLSGVIQNSAQDLYEVETEEGKKILIPAVDEFILDINMEEKQIRVKLIEGLI